MNDTLQKIVQTILSSSSDGIAIVDINGCFIEANPAFGRIFGREPEQVVGMPCQELFNCRDVHTLCSDVCMMHKTLQLQQPLTNVELNLSINGTPRSVELCITPVSVTDCLVIVHDVTAIRDATRLKANFLSMITHELRSPLNTINGYLDLTLAGMVGDLNEQQEEFIRRARAGSEHLYALIEDLLLVSRADAEQIRLNRGLNSLQEIVVNAVEELELMAKDHTITINVELPADLPPIYVDAVRIQQVLRNIISNALRFTPSDGHITIAASIVSNMDENGAKVLDNAEDKLLQIQVKDTGTGIDIEHQQRIFERFYQVPHSNANRVGGQGLGLAIVKMIVELHGGLVTVESVPGQGSTFSCLLPCLLS